MCPGLHLPLRLAFPERGGSGVVNRSARVAVGSCVSRHQTISPILISLSISPRLLSPPPPHPLVSSSQLFFFLLILLFSPSLLLFLPSPVETPTIRSHLSVCTSAIRASWQPNASHVPKLHTHTLRGCALTKQPENKSHHNLQSCCAKISLYYRHMDLAARVVGGASAINSTNRKSLKERQK